jgi:arginine N-succinyltransferase
MFLIREAAPQDLEQILGAAQHLDTVNLPHDRARLETLLELSARSFAGTIAVADREFLFVLEDLEHRQIIGTSLLLAQHGTRRAPHVFFEILEDERYSESLDRHMVHECLRIGYNYAGPTEIGGLILLPQFRGRGRPASLGKLLSYTRFLYLALHRPDFRDEVISELLPPLGDSGTSILWEHLGRHFTGLTYQEADKLSKSNKEFIRTLFPQGLIYTALLPREVRAVIGQVGPETRGVEKMLRAIGFDYARRIDPFDGGPHYQARTDDITLVQATRRAKAAAIDTADEGRPVGLVAHEQQVAPRFRAVGTRYRLLDDGRVGLPDSARKALGVQPGDEVAYLPLP